MDVVLDKAYMSADSAICADDTYPVTALHALPYGEVDAARKLAREVPGTPVDSVLCWPSGQARASAVQGGLLEGCRGWVKSRSRPFLNSPESGLEVGESVRLST